MADTQKGKAVIAAQRTSRFASRNPARLERQIADLKALQESSGSLGAKDKKQLEELERDVARVKKARVVLGDKAPQFGRGGGGEGQRGGTREYRGGGRGGYIGLGKRSWDVEQESETDEEVRKIPMPRDTPPPIPRAHPRSRYPTNPNLEPMGAERIQGDRTPHALPPKPETPKVEAKITYGAAPQVRNLRQEAVRAFVPSVVKRKLDVVKGGIGGKLPEPEDVERLEREGYLKMGKKEDGVGEGADGPREILGGRTAEERRLKEEEERFAREVMVEDVNDDDGM